MNQDFPDAVVTVRFDEQPQTGEKIAALVQQIINQAGAHYVEERRYYDGDVLNFGQTSPTPYEHIRVVPALDDLPYFAPEQYYSEVKVTSHSWGGMVHAIGYGSDATIGAVKAFAEKLTMAYQASLQGGDLPIYSAPESNQGQPPR